MSWHFKLRIAAIVLALTALGPLHATARAETLRFAVGPYQPTAK
ncbi:MAG: hypothetical protein U1E42_14060 [Rhodospirillales bacterium]